jgi:3-hydroxyisobutyrate dehydrogenase-like beta-hydroxyacid dehydrogenase
VTPDSLVGIVGLGRIGAAVAARVLTSGRPMIGWARRPESLREFAGRGGRVATSLAGLSLAGVVISVVFDDAALRDVALGAAGLVETMAPGAVHVAMQTTSPRLACELHDAHAARGQRFLSAPVFGLPEAAARGDLAIMCSGPEATFRAVDGILSAAGRTRWIGPKPEQAMLIKLVGNHMILTFGELLAEVFAVLRAGGIDAQDGRSALIDELMPRVFAGYVRRLADDPDAPRPAGTAIGRKDNALLMEAARHLDVDLALARCVAQHGTEP